MSLEQLAYLAEIIGVIAVVASLGYVGVQLKQNREALVAQTRQGILISSRNTIQALFDNPQIQDQLLNPEPLSTSNHLTIGLWYSLAKRHTELSWLQYKAGVMDDAQWSTELNWLALITASSRFRKWWSAVGRQLLGAPFVDFMEDLMADRPVHQRFRQAMTTWDLE